VLDDNKLLTLPNGERLNLPSNVRIMFEVEHLHYATLATFSRCGMIWFSEVVIEPSMVYRHYLSEYRKTPNGVILVPVQIGRWLVAFRDEINFPTQDKYGTQRVISFLRQLVECAVTGVLVTRPGSSWTIVIQLYRPISITFKK
jgi:hypothetical protein